MADHWIGSKGGPGSVGGVLRVRMATVVCDREYTSDEKSGLQRGVQERDDEGSGEEGQ